MRYIFSDDAYNDIIEIAAYLDSRSVEASIRISDEILEACEKAGTDPLLGQLKRVNAFRTIRSRLVNPRYPYLIVYDPNTDPIRILRVLHGARDLNRLHKAL